MREALERGERCVFDADELAARPTLKTVADAMPTLLLGPKLTRVFRVILSLSLSRVVSKRERAHTHRWPLAYGLLDPRDVITVDDAQIADALRLMAAELKQAVEPAFAELLVFSLENRLSLFWWCFLGNVRERHSRNKRKGPDQLSRRSKARFFLFFFSLSLSLSDAPCASNAHRPAGAVALAGVLSEDFQRLKNDGRPFRNVAAVICGGNVDSSVFLELMSKSS